MTGVQTCAFRSLLGLQLVLGVGAFVGRFTSFSLPGGTITGLILPVAHRLAGSLILGAAVVLALRMNLRGVTRSATASPGRSERWGVWGAISGPPMR